eukprot:gene19087-24915_t
MQDALDPLPGYVIKNIVSQELLNGADLSDLFSEFDDEPLGSASIAQVHKARLLDGRQVAVKVQRPGIEAKLLADITNLKSFAKIVSSSLPIDYYKVFCELEKSLKYELDFLYESQSTYKIASAVNHLPNNKPTKPPVVIPLPITGLVTRKVLVMEFIEGIPLSKLSTELAKRNITLNSIESKIFGNKLLSALTDAYGYMIFGSGIIHADPHPGNIFIMPDNSISLLDCGQIKELTTYQRLGLADLILSINKWEKLNKKIETSTVNEKLQLLPQLDELTHITATKVKSFNVRFKEGVNDTCAAAVAILLFGNTDTKLPGGYAGEEISKDSPIVQVAEFPQELVLLGRATVMIRGIANRLGISWGLSDRWAAIASDAIEVSNNPKESLPIWSVSQPNSFQTDGLSSLMSGNNVMVSTPTGSGKTIVGELAIYFALMMGLRVAYTTPLKALSNQKYQDFKTRFGGDRVGLLTGDIAINRGAPITIMTTEVFRNIVYDTDSSSQLSNLFMVCFDEFHFMNDPDRGTVWEESVISCPPSVKILALSATMGNVDEIKGWISSIHGPTDLILSSHRPVPLRYLFAMKQGLMPLFRDPNAGPGSMNGISKAQGKLDAGSVINPSIIKLEEQLLRKGQQRQTRSGRPLKDVKVNPNAMIPKYSDIAEKLQKLKLLPAIIFIFSRVGCEDSAKSLLQSGLKLLNDNEIQYVTQAVIAFTKINPEIPINKQSIQMLRAGVGVHHAGLIPVWKAFIEDLFNANKIKVLFATETLAAGVNMPARTTVISTVTKRVNSEIIRLKTSQLLQMAGRAGRRGKDDEGTVVIVKNRFEDSRMGHKILTSAIDDIKSHFKTSYGLAVKLLETRDIAACKSLIERGFGSYIIQQRTKKKETEVKKEIEIFRSILQHYSLKTAREFYKLLRRYEKEKRNEEFLIEKLIDTETDLIQAIADYMPLGVGLLLRNGETGFFLGDIKWGDRNQIEGYGVITISRALYLVNKEHIRCFTESDKSITAKSAQSLLDLGIYSIDNIKNNKEIIISLFNDFKSYDPIPIPSLPGSVLRQQSNDSELVIEALKYAATLKDPVSFVHSKSNNNNGINNYNSTDVFAWKMFQNVLKVLQTFNALNGTKATELGWTVGSLTADNELWLALVLKSQLLHGLNEAELAGVMSSLVVDGYKATNAYFKYTASERVMIVYEELEKLSWDLKLAQSDVNIDFPVNLCREVGGIAECWVNGVTWRDLCKDTSLDQGDVCRILRRTVEILRQIPNAWGISPEITDLALRAADKMDRFPVAELDIQTGESKDTSGLGFGVEGLAEPEFNNDDKGLLDTDFDNDVVTDSNNEVDDMITDLLGDDDDESSSSYLDNINNITKQKIKQSDYTDENESNNSNNSMDSNNDDEDDDSNPLDQLDNIDLEELLGLNTVTTNRNSNSDTRSPSKGKNDYNIFKEKFNNETFEDN